MPEQNFRVNEGIVEMCEETESCEAEKKEYSILNTVWMKDLKWLLDMERNEDK